MNDNFYRAFEDRYRGSRELVKSRLQVYVPFVEPLKSMYQDGKAVDLGCGRGEWLEILREIGVEATGVDLDDGMLAACRDRGLQAERGDAIAYLKGLPDASVAVVSGFHIAEHVAFSDLQTLVQEALRALKPAGVLILETPNPENIVVGTAGFYTDPTHQRPIPPRLLSFLPEHYGFARTKILRLQEPSGLAQAAAVNLMDVLGGVSPDYAVVAQKEADNKHQSELLDDAFQRNYGLELGTLAARHESSISGKLSEILSRVDRSAEFETRAQAATDGQARAQRQLATLEAELARTRQQLLHAQQQLSQTEQRLSQTEQQFSQTQRQLSQTQQQLSAVLASASWKLTAPLRTMVGSVRGMKGAPGRAVLHLKTWLKPRMIRVGAHIAARPALKSRLLRALRLFPRLHARLARAVRPGLGAATAALHAEQAGTLRVDDLTASARLVYQDLLDARDASSKRSGWRSRPEESSES